MDADHIQSIFNCERQKMTRLLSPRPKRKSRRSVVNFADFKKMELLTGVLVVCRERPHIDALCHVKQLIDEFAVGCNSLGEAAYRNNTRLMARVIRTIDTDLTLREEERLKAFRDAMNKAVFMGNLRVVEQLYAHEPASLFCGAAAVASLTSDLPVLKWFEANSPGSITRQSWETAFYVAVKRGDLETVQWLVNAFPETTWPLAAGVGQPEMAKLLLNEHVNLNALLTPTPDTIRCCEIIWEERERLRKKYKLERAPVAATAELTGRRGRKRTVEEAGIVDD